MGTPKLTISLGNEGTLGSLAFKKLIRSSLARVFVVSRTAEYPEWLVHVGAKSESEVIERKCLFVAAEDAAAGMAYSLRAGLLAALREEPRLDAVIIVLADQPLIDTEMINRLISEFITDRTLDYVASGDAGMAKPPVLLAASMFDALLRLEGDEGARKLLHGADYRGKVIAMESSQFTDMDTPVDVERVFGVIVGR